MGRHVLRDVQRQGRLSIDGLAARINSSPPFNPPVISSNLAKPVLQPAHASNRVQEGADAARELLDNFAGEIN